MVFKGRVVWMLLLILALPTCGLAQGVTDPAGASLEGDGGEDSVVEDSGVEDSGVEDSGVEATEPLEAIPFPDLDTLEPAVAGQLLETRILMQAALTNMKLTAVERGAALGSGCRLFHAYKIASTAAACYRNASRLAPQDPRWYHLLGYLQQQEGQLEAAVVAYRKELALTPNSVAARVRLGETLLELNRPEEATEVLDEALELDPTSAAAMAALGQAALSAKRYNEAILLFETALAAAPQATRLHYPLGLAYRGTGEMELARHHLALRGPVGVAPRDPWVEELPELTTGEVAHLLRGRLAFKAGKPSVAIQEFRKAVDAAPDSARARVNLGSAYSQLGESVAAAEQFREALRLDANNGTAHFNLGVTLAHRGELVEASSHLLSAVRLDPEDAVALRELAAVLARGGNHEKALQAYGQAVRLAPADEEARLGEARELVTLERYAAAASKLRAALELIPGSGQLTHALARLLAASPDPAVRDGEQALRLARSAFDSRPSVGHAETVAMALAELGHCEQAAEWQRKALEASQSQPAGAAAAAAVARLQSTLKIYESEESCRYPLAENGGSTITDRPN